MFQMQKLILFFLFFSCYQVSFSQIAQMKSEPSGEPKDIQLYATKTTDQKEKPVPNRYKEFEGKIIRKITIETLDPFGYSEIDSTKKPDKKILETGNRMHIKTREYVIRDLLIIKKNKPLDSLLVKESERLIRTQKYIRSVHTTFTLPHERSDSVDVYIRVLDSWSLIPKTAFSSSKASIEFNENNFMGIGHEFNNKYINTYSEGKNAYALLYIVPNIKNTFIKTTLNYAVDSDHFYSKSLDIDRPFYSPFAKWAGGINFREQFRQDTLQDSNLIYAKQNFKFKSQDYWAGLAFRIFDGSTEAKRVTNLIVSARFLDVKYPESPTIEYDPIDFYSDEKFILSGIGITSRKFVQDRYIFRNGIIEDVPIGRIYGITGGYQHKNNLNRYYVGSQVSFGDYHKWGFLSTNFEFGTFFEKSKTIQTAFTIQANYFTKLFEFGNWKLRQFAKQEIIIGINRLNSNGDNITINEGDGISGFSSALYGTEKMALTLQTQTYSPWNLWGFRLNPYFNYAIAILGTPENGLFQSKAYSKIGIGFSFSNDALVFSNLQISLSYYPYIPGAGHDIFKTNSFESSDFGFQAFELAKPRTVIYK
ncbi:Outer membrane protein assembly factor BamA [compost metagenome]